MENYNINAKFVELKWQIHAETSLAMIFLQAILINLSNNHILNIFLFILIIGNIFTLLKSLSKLAKSDKNYFK